MSRMRIGALAGMVLYALWVASGTWAAEPAAKMDLDACKTVLEKLKTAGTIKSYDLQPGAEGTLKLNLSGSGIIDLTPLKGMPLEWLRIDGSDQNPSKVVHSGRPGRHAAEGIEPPG